MAPLIRPLTVKAAVTQYYASTKLSTDELEFTINDTRVFLVSNDIYLSATPL